MVGTGAKAAMTPARRFRMTIPFTSQMRRLRHIYSMLQNLEKEGLEPNLTVNNILLDIRLVVEAFIKRTKV